MIPMSAVLEATEIHPALAEADELWAHRADGADADHARPASARTLVAQVRKGLIHEPRSIEGRWRLLRALYFQGDYATTTAAEAKAVFAEGAKVADEAMDLLRAELAEEAGRSFSGKTPVEMVPLLAGNTAAASFFEWAAVVWGKWALAEGMLAAVRRGVAGMVRDYGEALSRLDPYLDDAAADRTLGRLHHKTPSVPLLTGWASGREAVKLLRRSVEKAPTSLTNRSFLAEALWDVEPGKRDEAIAIAQAVVKGKPAKLWVVEHERARADARAFLKAAGR